MVRMMNAQSKTPLLRVRSSQYSKKIQFNARAVLRVGTILILISAAVGNIRESVRALLSVRTRHSIRAPETCLSSLEA